LRKPLDEAARFRPLAGSIQPAVAPQIARFAKRDHDPDQIPITRALTDRHWG
jgi:hypothetical protein